MKRKIIVSIGIVAVLMAIPFMMQPVGAKPSSFSVSFNQAQFQWRATSGPFGVTFSYQNDLESSTYVLTGNTLHTSWTYSPLVTDLRGQSTVYTYDKTSGLWIEHEGQVGYMYVAGYGPYQIVNFFRGYIEFSGVPNTSSFVHGVAYQWVYLYAPFGATPPIPNAIWDSTIGAWLVGFSTYLWDNGPQNYPVSTPVFPSGLIEPVPASNYNPLGL